MASCVLLLFLSREPRRNRQTTLGSASPQACEIPPQRVVPSCASLPGGEGREGGAKPCAAAQKKGGSPFGEPPKRCFRTPLHQHSTTQPGPCQAPNAPGSGASKGGALRRPSAGGGRQRGQAQRSRRSSGGSPERNAPMYALPRLAQPTQGRTAERSKAHPQGGPQPQRSRRPGKGGGSEPPPCRSRAAQRGGAGRRGCPSNGLRTTPGTAEQGARSGSDGPARAKPRRAAGAHAAPPQGAGRGLRKAAREGGQCAQHTCVVRSAAASSGENGHSAGPAAPCGLPPRCCAMQTA